MTDPNDARTFNPLNHQEHQTSIPQDDRLVVDPTLDRLVAHVNAAADRTAPAVDVDNLLANVYAQTAEEDRVRAVAQAAAEPDLIEGDRPARALAMAPAERARMLGASAARLARRARYGFRPAQIALFFCAAYSAILMLSVGYDLRLLGLLGAFVTGVATAIAASDIVPKYRAARRCRRLVKQAKRWDGVGGEQGPLSDTPIFDLTIGSYGIDVKTFTGTLANHVDDRCVVAPLPRSATALALARLTVEEQATSTAIGGYDHGLRALRPSLWGPGHGGQRNAKFGTNVFVLRAVDERAEGDGDDATTLSKLGDERHSACQ